METKVNLGKITFSSVAVKALAHNKEWAKKVGEAIHKHSQGNFGYAKNDKELAKINSSSLVDGTGRFFSVHKMTDVQVIVVKTENDVTSVFISKNYGYF